MSNYVCNCLTPYSSQRSNVESIAANLRKNLYSNDLSGNLSMEQKKANKEILVTKASSQLNNEKITGFNKWAFFLGLAGFHTGKIFKTKTLFHEMGQGSLQHAALAIGVGVVSGVLIGNLFSYDMGLYSRWRQARRIVDKYEREFSKKI